MSVSILSLLGFVAWALALLMVGIAYRAAMVFSFTKKADAWTRGRDPEDPAVFKRTADAYLNCLEMLPMFAAVILAAAVLDNAVVTNGLAMIFLAARVGQSLAHVISVHHLMIFFVRFPLFMVQVVILVWWLLKLTGIA